MQRVMQFGMLVNIFLLIAVAQEDPFARGRQQFNEQEWKEAIASFTEVIRTNPQHEQGWFWLGLSRYQAGAYEGAIAALEKAYILGVQTPFAHFAVARVFARTGDTDLSFMWLERAAKAGFAGMEQLESDEAFTVMRKMLQMDEIRRRIDRNTRPAEHDNRYRQMDFWIGEWEVFDQSGKRAGTNTITKELGGAMLFEQWTSASGIQGSSITFFDPGTGKFKQQWVSQSGYNTAYEGEMVNGSMVMIGINADIKGVVSKNRMTFTPNADGTVTQLIESYDDSAETWSQSFLGTYKRKPATPD